ncbi:hypothetical protein ScPMuIL_001117 [Solemya velum]
MGHRCPLFAAVIFILLVTPLLAEIHRAKKVTSKFEKRNRDLAARLSARDVALDAETEGMVYENGVPKIPRSMEGVWINSLACAVLVGLSGVVPLLIIPIDAGPNFKHGSAANRLKLLLSFAVGGLLGDVFLHLLPEAWAHIDEYEDERSGHMAVGLWVLTGILSFLVIEKVFAVDGEFEHMTDECDDDDEEDEKMDTVKELNHNTYTMKESALNNIYNDLDSIKHRQTCNGQILETNGIIKNGNVVFTSDNKKEIVPCISGYLNLLANIIDNFTHGLAIGGSFVVSNRVGCLTTLAILLHEIPHEIGDFAILLRSGFDRIKAAKAQMVTATGGILGVVAALSAKSAESAGNRTAWILPFTSGGFIYIALITVLPDLLDEKHGRESVKQVLCIVAGIAVMLIITLIH